MGDWVLDVNLSMIDGIYTLVANGIDASFRKGRTDGFCRELLILYFLLVELSISVVTAIQQ